MEKNNRLKQLQKSLQNPILIKKKEYGKTPTALFGAKKIIVEYTDPNILKEFHIGHLMSNSIGEAISRLIEFGGAKVKRTTWQSDVGLGIAKAVYQPAHNCFAQHATNKIDSCKYSQEARANAPHQQ